MKTLNNSASHVIIGLAGPELSDEERRFIEQHPPGGVILFSRNCHNLSQVWKLVKDIRAAAPQNPPTLWIDQEGGRVQRLRQPLTRYPSAWRYRQMFDHAPTSTHAPSHVKGLLQLAGQLCGQELATLGIGVNCAPVLDIREEGADPVIGDRAFGSTPEGVVELAGAWLDGLTASGVMAVGKHFPGHGAARSDSHKALPVIAKSWAELEAWELLPFRRLLPRLPCVMTAHLVATGLDPDHPATWSSAWLQGVLRQQWGYQGLIVADALEMHALSGSMRERARRALVAGCDLVLCCTGRLTDNEAALDGVIQARGEMPSGQGEASAARVATTLARHRLEPGAIDALLADPDYRRERALLEQWDEESLAADPTEVLQREA